MTVPRKPNMGHQNKPWGQLSDPEKIEHLHHTLGCLIACMEGLFGKQGVRQLLSTLFGEEPSTLKAWEATTAKKRLNPGNGSATRIRP